MKIKTSIQLQGKSYNLEYHDASSFTNLPLGKIRQAYGLCFYNGKLLLGHRHIKDNWAPIGGTREEGEMPEQTLKREIKEESNMELLSSAPIGYQQVIDPEGQKYFQLRYCCLVRPYGEFIADPDLKETGGIDAIQFIDPAQYKQYFDWGKIGDCLMARALEVLPTL